MAKRRKQLVQSTGLQSGEEYKLLRQAGVLNKSKWRHAFHREGKSWYDFLGIEGISSDLLNEWHPTKNDDLNPYQAKKNSSRKIWWRCSQGHAWKASLASRTAGSGCPYCCNQKTSYEQSLSQTHLDIAKKWSPKNRLKPTDVVAGSNKKVWWKCKKGHEWYQAICTEVKVKRYCPKCNNLVELFPEIAKEWHSTKNGELTPNKAKPKSHKKVWWQCSKGHEYEGVISGRTRHGCPICSGRNPSKEDNLAVKNPNLSKEWHPTKNGDLTPHGIKAGSGKKVWWKGRCGHEWEAVVGRRNNGARCNKCFGPYKNKP